MWDSSDKRFTRFGGSGVFPGDKVFFRLLRYDSALLTICPQRTCKLRCRKKAFPAIRRDKPAPQLLSLAASTSAPVLPPAAHELSAPLMREIDHLFTEQISFIIRLARRACGERQSWVPSELR